MSETAFELEPTNMTRCYQCDKLKPVLSDTSRCMECLQANHDNILKMNDSMMKKFARVQLNPSTGFGEWIHIETFVERSLGLPGMVLDIAIVDEDFIEEDEPLTDSDTHLRVESISIEQVNTVIESMKKMAEACGAEGEHVFFLRTSKYNAVSLGEQDE